MLDDRHLFERLSGTARFDFAVRHCPKCGWVGAVSDATLRYCGPGQRVGGDWGEVFLLEEAGPSPCSGSTGEHFHWQCAVCRYSRILPLPNPERPGVN